MRCKKHALDVSSVAGVCASCLRERLLALVAAQAQAEAQLELNYHHHQHLDGAQLGRAQSRDAAEASRKSDARAAHPPPLVFPSSVSPYVSRRGSHHHHRHHHHHHHHHHRFYSTPQVGPTYISSSSSTTADAATISTSWKKKHGSRFSFLTDLFWSRSEKLNPDPPRNGHWVSSGDSCDPSSSSSPLWFSGIFSGRRKKQSPSVFSSELSGPIGRKLRRRADRGMSPTRSGCSDDYCDGSPSDSVGFGECSQVSRKPPAAQALARRGKSAHSNNASGLAFCLSPLVRASPSRQRNQKGGPPPDIGFSGEVRVQGKPHLSTAASFCANRSRKLVDFGKVNHNR